MPMREQIKNYFCNDNSTDLNQVVTGFTIGLLFGPFSSGFMYFISFAIFYEIVMYYFTEGKSRYWRMVSRISVNCASLLGWICGRWLINGKTGFERYMRDTY
jgi:hypothetical protein